MRVFCGSHEIWSYCRVLEKRFFLPSCLVPEGNRDNSYMEIAYVGLAITGSSILKIFLQDMTALYY